VTNTKINLLFYKKENDGALLRDWNVVSVPDKGLHKIQSGSLRNPVYDLRIKSRTNESPLVLSDVFYSRPFPGFFDLLPKIQMPG